MAALRIRPTSTTQAGALAQETLPPIEQVAPGIRAVPVPLGGRFSVAYTLAYLIEDADGAPHIVDPGWDEEPNEAMWTATLAEAGHRVEDVRSITATHAHRDHVGLAPWLQRRSGAPLLIHRREWDDISAFPQPIGPDGTRLRSWGAPAHVADATRDSRPAPQPPSLFREIRFVDDGDLLPFAGVIARVLHTPGHTSGHIAIDLPATGQILTGDHVLPHLNPGIGVGLSLHEDPVQAMLDSLKRVESLDREVLPGHGYRFTAAATRAVQLRDHILRRRAEVAAAIEPRATTWDIASRVTWSRGFDALAGHRLVSALHQVNLYRAHLHPRSGRD